MEDGTGTLGLCQHRGDHMVFQVPGFKLRQSSCYRYLGNKTSRQNISPPVCQSALRVIKSAFKKIVAE